ncbi:TRAP transporter small permease [Cohaesibacter marisflavi]|uniref:TRAP transporter small permease n=1 Tax=Cohaesibacter marisflavi TaxID=655353 RepID=UPI0029C92C71|nr:TRAP transporter small permease [Cohaesibacter marisflavi]
MQNPTTPTNKIEKTLDAVNMVLNAFLALLVFGIFFVLLLQVCMRYFLAMPLYWAEEAAKYLMIYVTSVGAATAYRHYAHPRLMIVIAMIPRKTAIWYDFFLRLPVAIFFVYLIYIGWGYALANEWMMTPGLQISFFWPFLAIPFGACFVLLYLILDSINILFFHRSWILEPEFLVSDDDPISETQK